MSWTYHILIHIGLVFDFYNGRNVGINPSVKSINLDTSCVGVRLWDIKLERRLIPRLVMHILRGNGLCFGIIGHTAITITLHQSPFAIRIGGNRIGISSIFV